jgi:hypothetical protein
VRVCLARGRAGVSWRPSEAMSWTNEGRDMAGSTQRVVYEYKGVDEVRIRGSEAKGADDGNLVKLYLIGEAL